MKVSVGKPVLAAMSVACIAVPAATGVASAATPASNNSPVRVVAAAAAPVDPNAILNLLTFPYHNAFGIAVGVGTAANAGLNAILLPVSIASFVAVNQSSKIPAYVQQVQTNLANAFPGIIKSIQAEVAYDQNLFANLGATQAAQSRPSAADVNAVVAAASGTPLLDLLTFPYHNALGIAIGFGTAANAVLNLALLPVSIASFVAVNQSSKIPAYVQQVQTNLANAIPTIIKSVQAEVAYDQHLFSTLGTITLKQPAMAALEAPQVKKIAAGTEADAPKALAAGDSAKDGATSDSTPAKDGKPAKDPKPSESTPAKDSTPADSTPAKDPKPSESTPAKDSTPAESTPAKDSTPDKDGKPGKTGVHHQGGAATGTDGASSTPSKHTGAGKHRAAAGAGSAGAGSTGHGRHAKK
jgi:hypothetical protein